MGNEARNRIRELREVRGISGTKLAELLNISPQYLYQLERGEKRLNEDLIIQLARILQVTTDELLGYAKEKTPLPEIAPEERRLIRISRRFLPEDLSHLVAFLERVAPGSPKIVPIQKLHQQPAITDNISEGVTAAHREARIGEDLLPETRELIRKAIKEVEEEYRSRRTPDGSPRGS